MIERATLSLSNLTDVYEQLSRKTFGDWLSRSESERIETMGCEASRRRWLAGRWLAKQALRDALGDTSIRASSLHIESRDERGRAAAPRVYRDGRLTGIQLSISHAGDSVASVVLNVTVSDHFRARVGIDLVGCHPMPSGMSRFWLCDREIVACGSNLDSCQFIWSLKEALYKAGVQGPRVPFSPRLIDTTHWISPTLLAEATKVFRSAKRFSSAINHGGALQVLRHGDEVVTLVILDNPARVKQIRTSPEDCQPNALDISCASDLIPIVHGTEAVAR